MNVVEQHQNRIALIRRIPRPMSLVKRAKYTIEVMRSGGALQVGKDVFLVEKRHRYVEDKTWEWFELELTRVSDGETIFLEFEHDDRLEMSLWLQTGLPLHTIGVRQGQLNDFDEKEEGTFFYAGSTYVYEESDKALFYPGETGAPIRFYYWDFSELGGDRLIGVEDWSESDSERDVEVCIGRVLKSREVTILALGGEGHA